MQAISRTLIRQQTPEDLSSAVETAMQSYDDAMAEVDLSSASLAPNDTLDHVAASAQPEAELAYAEQARKNKERAAQIIKTGTVMDAPCEKCKIKQKTDHDISASGRRAFLPSARFA